jgi:DNA-binding transcriptional LysR family regulator
MWSAVELRELRIFLALAEELHFGRTAERLRISQPGVSESIRSLEARLGARLFDRTSRRVRLTPAGQDFRRNLVPALAALDRALAQASDNAAGVAGPLRIGFTSTSEGPALNRLIEAFQARHPDCQVSFHEAGVLDPYGALRRGDVDVLVNWLAANEPGLTAGPPIARCERVLAVACHHRLASRASVLLEDLGEEQVAQPLGLPAALCDAILPPRTPSGRPIPRTERVRSVNEIIAHVARGEIVHPTMAGVSLFGRDDIVLVPIEDLPPLPVGLIWSTARENAKIRALGEVARTIGPYPAQKARKASPRPTEPPRDSGQA